MTKENSVFRRLSVAAFARSAAQMEGVEPLASFRRLADGAQGDVSHAVVRWSARGEIRSPPGGFEQVWLHLVVRAGLPKICQRCLGPLEVELCVDRWFRFVADEATAAAQDEQVEEDLQVLSREFDLAGLIEDELNCEIGQRSRHTERFSAHGIP